MKNLILLFFFMFLSGPLWAAEFRAQDLTFDFLSTDGSTWYDCVHEKSSQPHGWKAVCGPYVFNMHIMLKEYQRPGESTFEFHFWADETAKLFENHTQSTWLTVDSASRPKNIISYLGFSKDTTQLRIGIKLQ